MTALLGLLAWPVQGTAIEFDYRSPSGGAVELQVGETFVLELDVSNPDQTSLRGVFTRLFGYDESIADYVDDSGISARGFFNQVCIGTQCFGGLYQGIAIYNVRDLREFEDSIGDPYVVLMNAIELSPTDATGDIDPGWDGTVGSPDFVMTFVANGVGTTVLDIGGELYLDDYSLQEFSGPSFTIHVVPEPGTALLLGLGLACLGRRRHVRVPAAR